MFQTAKKIILLIGDLLFLFLALWATLLIRYPGNEVAANFNRHLPHFLVVFFIFLIIFYINGNYNLNVKMRGRQFFLKFEHFSPVKFREITLKVPPHALHFSCHVMFPFSNYLGRQESEVRIQDVEIFLAYGRAVTNAMRIRRPTES